MIAIDERAGIVLPDSAVLETIIDGVCGLEEARCGSGCFSDPPYFDPVRDLAVGCSGTRRKIRIVTMVIATKKGLFG